LEGGELRETVATLQDLRTQDAIGAVLAVPGLMVVDVYTPSCIICRRVEPMVAALADTSEGAVRAWKLDAEAHPEFAERHHVQGVPTLLLFHDGRLIDRKSGFLTASELRRWVGSKRT
jgi:thioredoxin-like negative regulator of GroEL